VGHRTGLRDAATPAYSENATVRLWRLRDHRQETPRP
jgi:hypothetical protein